MKHSDSKFACVVRQIICAFAVLVPTFFLASASADAAPGDFELGVSAGYAYGAALNPVDGSQRPEPVVAGHGFSATIFAGGRFSEYLGLYADFGLSWTFSPKAAQIGETVIRKHDPFYAYSVLLTLRAFQPMYSGEFVESIGLGYDYAGDGFASSEKPGSGFGVKVSVGYLHHMTENFEIGIVIGAMMSHKFERDYANFTADAQLETVWHF